MVHRSWRAHHLARDHRDDGPLATGVIAVYILAWTAIFGGIAQIIYAFQAHSGGRTFLELILGVVYLIAGFYLVSHPLAGLLTVL